MRATAEVFCANTPVVLHAVLEHTFADVEAAARAVLIEPGARVDFEARELAKSPAEYTWAA